MQPSLTKDRFTALAQNYPVVPITVEILGDRETPVSIFEKLVGEDNGFLLESLEGGERWARWSFVGWNPEFTLLSHDGETIAQGGGDVAAGDPLTVLESTIARYSHPPVEQLGFDGDVPPLFAGAVGYLAYDAVRYIESIPSRPPDDRGLPEMVWQFVGSLAIFDHYRQTILLVRNVFVGDDPEGEYDAAVADLETTIVRLGEHRNYDARPRPSFEHRPAAHANVTKDEFEEMVLEAKEHILAGDAFQIVPSLRLEVNFDGDPFEVYRSLRLVNPSPFLFFVRHDGVTVCGSSPEVMTRARDGIATSRPIAGTRPRGRSDAEDEAYAEDLLADEKERAEHVMLVDLSRNDLGRVCAFGSVHVDELMVIERYSHVMHIVSGVTGKLTDDVGPVDLLRATFPHGTVSGAPKVRAIEIIDELEPTARGPYAGAVGYIDFSGNVDTCIAIRTLIVADGKAWVQAGAGVVADSDPATEYQECMNKAAAVLAAVEGARHV